MYNLGYEKMCINLAFSYLVLVSPCILCCKDNMNSANSSFCRRLYSYISSYSEHLKRFDFCSNLIGLILKWNLMYNLNPPAETLKTVWLY